MNFSAPELSQIPMSTELATTLAHATDAAGQMGFPEVNLEHLLAALCDDPEALAILDSSGVDAARVRSDAVAFLSRTAGPPITDRSSLFLSEEVKRIIEAATAAARGGRRRDINGAILLAAIVGDGRSLAAQMLQSHGLSFESAIKALQSSIGQPPRERAMERPMLADEVLARARERVQSRAAPSLRQIMSDMPLSAPPPSVPMPEPPAVLHNQELLSEPTSVADETTLKTSELLETLKAEASEPTVAAVDEAIAALDAVEVASAPSSDEPAPRDDAQKDEPASEEPARQVPVPESVAASPADLPPPPEAVAGPAAPAAGFAAPSPGVVADTPAAPTKRSDDVRNNPETAPLQPESTIARAPSVDRPPASTPGPVSPNPVVPQQQPFAPLTIERPRPGPDLPPPIPPNALPPGMPPLTASKNTGPAPNAPAPYPSAPPLGPGGPLSAGPRLPPQGLSPGGRAPQGMTAGPHGPPVSQARTGPQQQPVAPQPIGRPAAGPAPAPRERPAKGDGSPLQENIPRTMRADTTERIEIRIARAAMKALGSGPESPHSGRRYGVGTVQAVAVRLKAPEGGFFIETASPESQWIDGQSGLSIDEFASWRFNITPQSRGRVRLQIMTSARIVGSDGIAVETPMPDQVVEVKVRRNTKRSIARWFGWLIAAAVGAAIALGYERGLEKVQPLIERLTN